MFDIIVKEYNSVTEEWSDVSGDYGVGEYPGVNDYHDAELSYELIIGSVINDKRAKMSVGIRFPQTSIVLVEYIDYSYSYGEQRLEGFRVSEYSPGD